MIGIFDSGSGGLTVLKAIRGVMPSADILYFGDIKNAPYGNKTRAELSEYTVCSIQLLLERGATTVVSACNSLSASLAISLLDVFDLEHVRLFEMVGPTVRFFKNSDAKLLVCATPATIESGIYQNAFHMIGKEVAVCPIPDLAKLIEFGADNNKIENSIKQAFKDIDPTTFDALLLSCTHYPLVEDTFKNVLAESLSAQAGKLVLFDPAEEVARRVQEHCWQQELGESTTTFLLSKDSDTFRNRVDSLFPNMQYTVEII